MIKQIVSLGILMCSILPSWAGVTPSDCIDRNEFVNKIEAVLLVSYEGTPVEIPIGKTKSGQAITSEEAKPLLDLLGPMIYDGWKVVIKSSPTGDVSIIVGE